MLQSQVLYNDKDVKIRQKCVTIKNYYFPIATSKRIPIEEIKEVYLVQQSPGYRIWGTSTFDYWFALDKSRADYENFIAIELFQSSIKPAFTCTNNIKQEDVNYQTSFIDHENNHLFTNIKKKHIIFIFSNQQGECSGADEALLYLNKTEQDNLFRGLCRNDVMYRNKICLTDFEQGRCPVINFQDSAINDFFPFYQQIIGRFVKQTKAGFLYYKSQNRKEVFNRRLNKVC